MFDGRGAMGPTMAAAAVAASAEDSSSVQAAAAAPPLACNSGLSCLYCERALLPHDDVALVRCTVCNAVLHLCDACILGGGGRDSAKPCGSDAAVVSHPCSSKEPGVPAAEDDCGRSPDVTPVPEYHCQRHAHLRGR